METEEASPEQVVHDVLIVLNSVLREVARREQDDGVHLISTVTWQPMRWRSKHG